MPDAYEIAEGRYIAAHLSQSAVAGLYATLAACPANKVWTYTAVSYENDIAGGETKNIWLVIVMPNGPEIPIYPFTSVTLKAGQPYGFLQQGNEVKIFPGEQLRIYRDSATAGSTLTIRGRYIESSLPIFKQYEPQIDLAQNRRVTTYPLRSPLGTSRAISGGHEAEQIGGGQGGGGQRQLPKGR